MKKLSIGLLTSFFLFGVLSVGAKDAYVYTPDVNLISKIDDVRLIDLTANKVRLVNNGQGENVFGGSEVGYISFSARKPLSADDEISQNVTIDISGLNVTISGVSDGAVLLFNDVLGRVEQQVTAPNATLVASRPGIYILSVFDKKGFNTYKIILK